MSPPPAASAVSTPRSSFDAPRPSDSHLSPPGLGTVYQNWSALDPRSSSTQSLVPSEAGDDEKASQRRTLLIVYIHGFMGDASSFRSFPAHVHHFLKNALADTHVVHSKIYPRYKTYKAIDVATENFSKWLLPHESDTTDVILLGHSMGGLLAADVVLLPAQDRSSGFPFRHRILGTISLDSPFLGLHPGIIASGIASLFRPTPEVPKENNSTASPSMSPPPSASLSPEPSIHSGPSSPPLSSTVSQSSFSSLSTSLLSSTAGRESDPGFNPPFWNDVLYQDRGWLRNVAHFAKKHESENIFSATYKHLLSHLEFGGCLADYPGLNTRYSALRRLEDVDDVQQQAPGGGGGGGSSGPRLVRVRFVNYYTISTGRAKKDKDKDKDKEKQPDTLQLPSQQQQQQQQQRQHDTLGAEPGASSQDAVSSQGSTPRISIEDHSDSARPTPMQLVDPMPEPDASDDPPPYTETADEPPSEPTQSSTGTEIAPSTSAPDLPPIPPVPEAPQPPDFEQFQDKEARKQAEKEAKRAQKTYDQAVKDRDKAVRERERLIEKRRQKEAKEAEKRQKEADKRERDEQKRLLKEQQALDKQQAGAARETERERERQAAAAKKKERKFCMLPRRVNGVRDTAWIQVYMEGVDEVGAHCGLFFPGPHYERLVGEVGSMIVTWVHEDASQRAIKEMHHLQI